jgi:hypothetical protein
MSLSMVGQAVDPKFQLGWFLHHHGPENAAIIFVA